MVSIYVPDLTIGDVELPAETATSGEAVSAVAAMIAGVDVLGTVVGEVELALLLRQRKQPSTYKSK